MITAKSSSAGAGTAGAGAVCTASSTGRLAAGLVAKAAATTAAATHSTHAAAPRRCVLIHERRSEGAREGKPPLFGVWVLRLAAPGDDAAAAVAPDAPLVVRDAQGARTPAYARVLADLAMV